MITKSDVNKPVLLKIEKWFSDNGACEDRHQPKWENLGFRICDVSNDGELVFVVRPNDNVYMINANSVRVID